MLKPIFLYLLITPLILLGSTGVSAESQEGLVARWSFDSENVVDATARDQIGGLDATIEGPVEIVQDKRASALLINRDKNGIKTASKPEALPTKEISVEAWLSIEKTVEWGGIVGTLSGEKGWLLGYRQSSFSFGVSGKETAGLTHLRAPGSLEWGRWYHVVGTYDGSTIQVFVDGKRVAESDAQKGEIDYPGEVPLTLGSFEKFFGRLLVHEISIYSKALKDEDIVARYEAKKDQFRDTIRVKLGPYLERTDRDSITVGWITDVPCSSIVYHGGEVPLTEKVVDATPKTQHEITVPSVEPQRLYYYRVGFLDKDGAEQVSRLFEVDTSFDFVSTAATIDKDPFPKDELSDLYSRTAERIVQDTGIKKGYCMVLGCGTGRLAFEIAKRTDLDIVCLDENEENIAATRKALDEAGIYGIQATARECSLSDLPYPDYMANLIVSDSVLMGEGLETPVGEVYRVLRPEGGVAFLGQPESLPDSAKRIEKDKFTDWAKSEEEIPELEIVEGEGLWAIARRESLAGAGEWTHQYGDPGNSACSQDELAHGDLRIQWFGKPGPRSMMDRGTRSPAPLCVGGRMFVQGDRRLFGLDAYNGTILWTLDVPDFRRANMPRDSGNMTATEDALYAAVRDKCWKLNPQTGARIAAFDVCADAHPDFYDWGYLSVVGETLFGSAVRHGSIFIGADGEWYDKPNEESGKVTSDFFLAMDRHTGEEKWTYTGGLIVNPTIAIGDGTIYFIETKKQESTDGRARRLGEEVLEEAYLVALDQETGRKKWEKPVEIEGGRWVLYLIYANDTVLVMGTTDQYHLHAFDAKAGEHLWEQHYGWRRDHHGGAMQHPVVIGDTVYGDARAFNLRTGELTLDDNDIPPRRGCGTMSGSAGALFFRHHSHTIWDLESGSTTEFHGIRAGCWLGMIPAGGLVLVPESSAGCFCSEPIQTSIAFAPVKASH